MRALGSPVPSMKSVHRIAYLFNRGAAELQARLAAVRMRTVMAMSCEILNGDVSSMKYHAKNAKPSTVPLVLTSFHSKMSLTARAYQTGDLNISKILAISTTERSTMSHLWG